MNIELTGKELRLLLDMAYIGNWVLNSARGGDRITEYDAVESKLFLEAAKNGMPSLTDLNGGDARPSKAYVEGGIHEAIMDYEDMVFFDILAEELARRDMQSEGVGQNDLSELTRRVDEYAEEFELHGLENINVDI